MRKMKIAGLAMIFLTFLVGTACKKEVIQRQSDKDLDPQRLPNITLKPTVSSSCGKIHPCLVGLYTTSKYNCVTTTKDALTIANYPNLRYTYYAYSSTDIVTGYKVFMPVGQFMCNANVVSFGDPILENNTEVYVLANIPAGTAPTGSLELLGSWPMNLDPTWLTSGGVLVTTGNFKGQTCPGGIESK